MVPKTPIILGLLCIGVLIASIIGINSSNGFSEFMDTTPLQNKLKADSEILFEINELALKYQENNEDKKVNEQRTLMDEKIIEIARDSFGTNNITMLDIPQVYFPIVKGSQVDTSGNQELFSVCDVAENIPTHIQKISNAEMFQMFAKKYSKYEMVLNIQDERQHNSLFHYGLQAISDDGRHVASTFFHADSCTNEITDFNKFHLSCLDKEKEEWTGGTNNPEYVRASIELDDFCMILLSPWHQLVSDYQDTISEKINEIQEKTITVEIQSLEDAMRLQSEMKQWILLSGIVGNIVQDYLEDEKTQDMIREYNKKYGDLPDELQELLDARPISKSNLETKNNDNDDDYDMQEYANTLSEINQRAITHQKNKEMEKFNEQMNLMEEKQKEIASNILGVPLSKVYVNSPFNFPFRDSSQVKHVNPEKQSTVCNIPKIIPTHLQTIQNSEMFQMFSEKYSSYPLTLEISDERNFESTVHYTLSATSDDENYYASAYFHINSCTGDTDPYLNLHCKNQNTDDFKHAFLFENIVMSLEDEAFCTITFMPWQEELFAYSENISEKAEKIHQKIMEGMDSNDPDDMTTLMFDAKELELLNRIGYEATRNLDEDYLKNSELIIEYNEKYGDLPDELQELLDARPISKSNIEEKDSDILVEINENAIIHQKNNENEEFYEQVTLMENKIKQIASDLLGMNITIALVDLTDPETGIGSNNFPFRDASEIKIPDDQEPFPICNIPEKIPIHLKKFLDEPIFAMFSKKYSEHNTELHIMDERPGESLVHYGITTTSYDGLFSASTTFHVNTCTDEIQENFPFLFCRNIVQNETHQSINRDDIIASLQMDDFCIIPLDPWRNAIHEYGKKIQEERLEYFDISFESKTQEEIMKTQKEHERLDDLRGITFLVINGGLESKITQEKITEYTKKFGSIPEELQELLYTRPLE